MQRFARSVPVARITISLDIHVGLIGATLTTRTSTPEPISKGASNRLTPATPLKEVDWLSVLR